MFPVTVTLLVIAVSRAWSPVFAAPSLAEVAKSSAERADHEVVHFSSSKFKNSSPSWHSDQRRASAALEGHMILEVRNSTWFLSGASPKSAFSDALAKAYGVGNAAVEITGISQTQNRVRRLRGRARRLEGSEYILVQFKISSSPSNVSVKAAGVGQALRTSLEDSGACSDLVCVSKACWPDSSCDEQACDVSETPDKVCGPRETADKADTDTWFDKAIAWMEMAIEKWMIPWGIVAGGVLLISICLCIFLCCRRRQKRREPVRETPIEEIPNDPPLFPGRKELPPVEEPQSGKASLNGMDCESDLRSIHLKFAVASSAGFESNSREQNSEGMFSPHGSDQHHVTCAGLEPGFASTGSKNLGSSGLAAAPFFGGNLGNPGLSRGLDPDTRPVGETDQLDEPKPLCSAVPQVVSQPIPPEALARWVRQVYVRYNPKKLNRVDLLLEEYKGREQDLINAISNKYRLHPVHFERHYTRPVTKDWIGFGSCGACPAVERGCGGDWGQVRGFAGILPDIGVNAPQPQHLKSECVPHAPPSGNRG